MTLPPYSPASISGLSCPSYGSSSTLAKQIENGAPAAIFLSADEQWMDYLDGKKLLVAGSRIDLLGNGLVLIAPKEGGAANQVSIAPGFPLAQLLGNGRLAMGDPVHVPAGLYGKAALESLGVWDQVKDRVAAGESVRAALAFVERGETPLGIVYATDATASAKVRQVGIFPDPAIRRSFTRSPWWQATTRPRREPSSTSSRVPRHKPSSRNTAFERRSILGHVYPARNRGPAS